MVHVTTVVGGPFVRMLPVMLRHYSRLGVSSFFVNVQLSHPDDPAFDRVKAVTDAFGIEIASVTVGPWSRVQKGIYAHSRQAHRHDWYILADQDELQVYPMPLVDLLEHCDAHGYDHITGCFVDRLAADGSLPPVDYGRAIEEQFPVKAFVSYPLSGCDPRKVVAAKGDVAIIRGQHYALNGRPCPMGVAFVQVHHFKWIDQLARDLAGRAALLKAENESHWTASARIISYLEQHNGRIDLTEPRFLASISGPGYDRWPDVTRFIEELNAVHVPPAAVY